MAQTETIDKLTIITNYHWHDLLSVAELPKSKQSDFDYIESDERHSLRIVKYKGMYSDVSEFMRISEYAPEPFKKWQGYSSDSFFSGLLVRYDEDNYERVQIALYLS